MASWRYFNIFATISPYHHSAELFPLHFQLQRYGDFPTHFEITSIIFKKKNKGGVQNVPSLYLCRRQCCVFSFYGILIPDGGHRENRTISPLTQMPILVIGRSRETAPLTGLRTTYLLAFREIFRNLYIDKIASRVMTGPSNESCQIAANALFSRLDEQSTS